MRTPQSMIALFLVLLAGVAVFQYYPQHQAEVARSSQLAAILAGSERVLPLDARSKSAGCGNATSTLPDHACTPGAIFPGAALTDICVAGYSKTVRNVSTKLREEVYAEYGIPYPEPRGTYEVDHLIPLAIGGSNDIANLFPQPAAPAPGFREKDIVEVYLQEEVCAGRVALAVAQERISENWLLIYDDLDPATIARIQAKYRSWAN